jgi:hypothetical protein
MTKEEILSFVKSASETVDHATLEERLFGGFPSSEKVNGEKTQEILYVTAEAMKHCEETREKIWQKTIQGNIENPKDFHPDWLFAQDAPDVKELLKDVSPSVVNRRMEHMMRRMFGGG